MNDAGKGYGIIHPDYFQLPKRSQAWLLGVLTLRHFTNTCSLIQVVNLIEASKILIMPGKTLKADCSLTQSLC
jgi:hypothetical protein